MARILSAAIVWMLHVMRANRIALGMLMLALSLGACTPAPDTSEAPAQGGADSALTQLERIGAAKPEAAAQQLLALQAKMAPASIEVLDAMDLRGMMLALEHDDAAIDAVVSQLENWPDAGLRDVARLAARHVRATELIEKDEFSEAALQFQGITAPLLKAAPPVLRIRFLRTMGRIKDKTGHVDDAVALYLQALTLAEQSTQSWRQALSRADLAGVYVQAMQLDRARVMADDAVRLAQRDPDPMTLLRCFNSKSFVYSQLNLPEETQRASLETIHWARQAGSLADLALALANQADDYLQAGDFVQAIKLSEEALPLAHRAKRLNVELLASGNIGLAKIGLGKIAEGKVFVKQTIDRYQEQGNVSSAGDVLREMGQYLERAGDLRGAVLALQQARAISDESLKQADRKAMIESQESFDSEHRAREIELLSRDKAIADEQLLRGSLQTRLWAVLAACFLLLGVLLLMLYQRVHKTNAALVSSNEQLKVQGEIDPLTGLANRRHFQLAIKRLETEGGLSGTVFLIDIDHFKQINDRFGHASGDAVLVEVAHRLRQAVRADDLVVRWGGEEFLIVIESRAVDTVQALAQRLLDLIGSSAVHHAEHSIELTASIGFASFPLAPNEMEVGWERAINLVDTVMYLAKAHGRNRAYGVNHVDVEGEAALDELAQGMDEAWREGRVSLTALQGPQHLGEAMA